MRALILCVAAAGLFAATGAKATMISDTFSFTGTYRNPSGTILSTQTVSGLISFAASGTNVAATSVSVTSAPPGTLGSADTAATNLLQSPAYVGSNSFTVEANGTIDAYNLTFVSDFSTGAYLSIGASGSELSSYSYGYYISNFYAPGPLVTFGTTAVAAVPEPATCVLLAGAALVLVVGRRRISGV